MLAKVTGCDGKRRAMLRVFSSEIPTEVPIVGGELTPKLRLLLPDDTLSTADVPPSAPVDGHYLRYKW